MATENVAKSPVKGYGYNPVIAWVRFTPVNGANPTIVSSYGVSSVVRDGEGVWTATLQERFPDLTADVQGVFSDAKFHELKVTALSVANGTATVSHKSVAYASIASGATADDVDGLSSVTINFRAVAG